MLTKGLCCGCCAVNVSSFKQALSLPAFRMACLMQWARLTSAVTWAQKRSLRHGVLFAWLSSRCVRLTRQQVLRASVLAFALAVHLPTTELLHMTCGRAPQTPQHFVECQSHV